MSLRTTLIATTAALVPALLPGLAPRAGAQTYEVDKVHSTLIFRIKHMNTSYFYGRFDDFKGTLAMAADGGSVDFEVKTASVDTGFPQRDGHLKSPDFFNAAQYPTIKFKSTKVTKSGDDYDVAGDLTLHGVTKPVSLKLKKTGEGKDMRQSPIVGYETNLTIKRSDYKMSNMAGALGDTVWLIVSLECGQKK